MDIFNIVRRILGWCPGVDAAMSFERRNDSSRLAGLALLMAAWCLGVWWASNTALSLSGMERLLFTNRATLLLLLGSIVVLGYTWKSFKPKDWELPEFSYKPLSVEDLPDIPIDAEYTWMSRGSGSSPSVGPGLRPDGDGYYTPGELRTPDIEEYRRKVEYYREQKRRREGVTAEQVHERQERMRINKRTVYTVLVVAVLIGFSCCIVLRQHHLVKQAYLKERFSGFEVIETKYPPSSGDPDSYIKWLTVHDFEQFLQVARQLNVEKIYNMQGEYFFFYSPIYNVVYRIYPTDIKVPN